ncbi:uncharacterized protein LOC105184654 [Harpegnathos saltator]|uniref:Uncharacterized protein n=1 Tax=Harpegnathos saltator TaxID=610380 RepID=E2BN14_HARSA|nr:uncharacterized protein LOC105184654 [Harpegnathos saltator]XP_011141863.1 uncharacterized protein LOC105184654 [Harpegnathos saltator]EFN82918.1 hypothetical protein EAI_15873 [Harpegnathos saltator]
MEDFIPTRASCTKEDYVSVRYNYPKKKSTSTDGLATKPKFPKNDSTDSVVEKTSAELKIEQEKEMKKARYDVIKFAMSGFDKVKARKTKDELAISLGAIPSKNKKMNYKKLKVCRKKMNDEKMKKEEHVSGFTSSLIKYKHKNLKRKKVHKKDSGILGVYGKIPKSSLPKQ